MKIEVEKTQDGWSTLFLPEENEHYHSTFGACQESQWIYIERGFSYVLDQQKDKEKVDKKNRKNCLKILEMGFGTGLNTILTLINCCAQRQKVEYTTVEAYPLSEDIILDLNYAANLPNIEYCGFTPTTYYEELHSTKWYKPNTEYCIEMPYKEINSYFFIKKINAKFEELLLKEENFDLVYYDAFSPRVQPQLWTEDIFRKIYENLNTNGCIITYCAQGKLKKILKEVGFKVESIDGPPGKREITRAIKI